MVIQGCGKLINWDSREWGYWWAEERYGPKEQEKYVLHLAWQKQMQNWGKTEHCGEDFMGNNWQFIYCRECILKSGLIW